MSSSLLIRGARQLLTLRGPAGPRRGPALRDLSIIQDGAVLIRDGIIQDLGPGRRVENLTGARDAEEIDATGRVVMPAFVDLETSLVHAHPSSESFKRLLTTRATDDATLREVLAEGAKSLAGLSSHSLRRRCLRIMSEMARYGTGTVESRAGYVLEETEIFKVLRVQSDHREGPVDVVSTLLLKHSRGTDPAAWVRWVTEELLPKVRHRRLAQFIDLEFEGDLIPAPLLMGIFYAASELGFGLKVHSEYLASKSAIPLATRCGSLSVANFRNITEDDIQMLAASSTIAVFKPGLLLQSGNAFPAPCCRMLEAGVIPALSSSYHAELSSGYNMQLMLMLACRLYGMSPEEAITSATINGAYALGADTTVGSIESGKQADILVLSIPDYREVAYYSGVNIVERTVKRGRLIDDND